MNKIEFYKLFLFKCIICEINEKKKCANFLRVFTHIFAAKGKHFRDKKLSESIIVIL